MHIKYFQPLADIERHYDDILFNFDEKNEFRRGLNETWGILPEDEADIIEEREVLRYLLGCRFGWVRNQNVKKPSLHVVERCFNRHITFLGRIYKLDDFNVNKCTHPTVKKEFKACRHYLFQFSLPAWYDKLPDEILTFENKYPDFE